MKKLVLFSSLFFCCLFLSAQTGYQIKISMKPFALSKVYLAYYYGKMKAIADSTMLDATGNGAFQGKKPLPGGIYFIVSPRKEILFEVLIDKPQQFTIKADTSNLPLSVSFTGSAVNSQFQSYTTFATRTGKAMATANSEYATAKKAADSASIAARIKKLDASLQHFRDSIIKKQPGSILATLFRAIKEPQVPPAAKHPGGVYDSNYAYNYYKAHYWDGIPFNDERLVRTPFFEPKLEKYYRDLVSMQPDSIKKEVDAMLLQARTSPEMFKYLLVHFVQKYINPEYMGQDAVFVHLFEKYINTGQADFFTAQYKEFASRRAYSLMANLIGQPAANLMMVDSTGKEMQLYDIEGEYVIVCFWDPTCSHCKEVVPKVDSFYKASWKQKGVKVYGVKVDGNKDEWIKFIKEYKLDEWIHVYQLPSQQQKEVAAGKPGFRQLYDVYQTPMLYLLDKEKRILAKKLTYQQIDEVLNVKSNTQKPK
jgi:cytochrome oxidase Cu insertion factor (SCO1/SenC/PrrC family)